MASVSMKLPGEEKSGEGTATAAAAAARNNAGDGFEVEFECSDEPVRDDDFSEYMWMENEKEFEEQVLKEMEEEELIKDCEQAMVEDEKILDELITDTLTNGVVEGVQQQGSGAGRRIAAAHQAQNGCDADARPLNPLAQEFVPMPRMEDLKIGENENGGSS